MYCSDPVARVCLLSASVCVRARLTGFKRRSSDVCLCVDESSRRDFLCSSLGCYACVSSYFHLRVCASVLLSVCQCGLLMLAVACRCFPLDRSLIEADTRPILRAVPSFLGRIGIVWRMCESVAFPPAAVG